MFRIDTVNEEVDRKYVLEEPVERVRVSEGHLILISPETVSVRTYRLTDLIGD